MNLIKASKRVFKKSSKNEMQYGGGGGQTKKKLPFIILTDIMSSV